MAEPGVFLQRCGGIPAGQCPCHGVQRNEAAVGSASWPLKGVAHAIQRSRSIPASQIVARDPRRVPIASGGSGERIPIASGGSGERIPIASGGSGERIPIASGGSGIRGTPVGKAGVVDQDDPGGKRGGTGVKLLDEPEGALLDRLEDNTKVTVVEEMPGRWYHVVTQEGGRAGYVKAQFVDFPPGGDPDASLYRITEQDKVGLYKLLAKPKHYGPFKERALLKLQLGDWGWDARFYANVVVQVNKEGRRQFIKGPIEKKVPTKSFPFFRIETDYTMMKDKRIWLPGKTYADTLHGTVPSGSTSYGVVEKAKQLWSIISEVAPFVAGLLVGAVEHLWNMVADIAKMIWGLFKSLITGTILSDARKFVEALWDMVKDPKKLLDAILGSLKKQWDKGWYERGKLIGMFLVEALIMILTFGSATAARATGWVKKLWDLLKTTKAGAALANLEKAAVVQKTSKVAQAVKARFAATAGAVGSSTTGWMTGASKKVREWWTKARAAKAAVHVKGAGGHTLTITRRGKFFKIFVCSSPCQELVERYDWLLKDHHDLAQRIRKIEDDLQAKRITRKKARKQAKTLQTELEAAARATPWPAIRAAVPTPTGAGAVVPRSGPHAGNRITYQFGDGRGKHTRVSDYPADEVKRVLTGDLPNDPAHPLFALGEALSAPTGAAAYGSQLTREGLARYGDLVRDALENGHWVSATRVTHSAAIEIGVNIMGQKMTRNYIMHYSAQHGGWHLFPAI